MAFLLFIDARFCTTTAELLNMGMLQVATSAEIHQWCSATSRNAAAVWRMYSGRQRRDCDRRSPTFWGAFISFLGPASIHSTEYNGIVAMTRIESLRL